MSIFACLPASYSPADPTPRPKVVALVHDLAAVVAEDAHAVERVALACASTLAP